MFIAYILAWFNAKYANKPQSASVAIYQVSGVVDVVADDLSRQYMRAIDWFRANEVPEDSMLMPSWGNPIVDEDGNRVHLYDWMDAYDEKQADLAANFGRTTWEYEIGVGIDGDDFIFEEFKELNENRIIWRTGFMVSYLELIEDDNVYPFSRLLGDMRGNYTKWLYLNDPDYAPMMWDNPF